MSAVELVARWDAQQAAYIAERESRFGAMLDVVGLQVGAAPVVVDLACGPGSLTARVLDRFPDARVVGVDHDPALLELARTALAHHGDRVAFVDVDLTGDAWPAQVREALGCAPSAAVSTTALHWLSPAELVTAYGAVHDLLAPAGVFLDGDHFRYDDRTPRLRGWAAAHDARTQEAAFGAGVDTWDEWWTALAAEPGMAGLVAERERRFADRTGSDAMAIDFRLAALAQAGFSESGTVWQLFDDFVVYGVV